MRRFAVAVLGTVLALTVGGCATPDGGTHATGGSPRPSGAAGSGPWRLVGRTGNPGTLKSVVATGAHDAWAVGDEGTAPVVMRWSGGTWAKVEVPERLGLESLRVVRASGPDDVWVFGTAQPTGDGRAQEAHAARWNGSRWTLAWRGPNSVVDAATVAGPGDVWVAGRRLGGNGTCRSFLRHHAAAGWSAVALPSTVCVRALHALSPRDVWAVGEDRGRPVTLHWDGGSWRTVPLPPAVAGSGGELDGLAAQSPTQVWAVGRAGRTGGVAGPVAVRWDGHRWVSVAGSGVGEEFSHPAADGHGGIFAAASTARVLHYDGRNWTSEHVASEDTINGLAVIPGTSHVLAVGVCCDADDEDTTGKIWMRR
ncbi:hypothetical protein ABZ341_17515 [Streptomyces sp. NPDC006173]|uniref:hypothetical protein n=1 Tax=Streptomyces sp. NPDC006173 TaxID=3155349 RepID=UPI00340C296F